ncbi:MAG TPA: HD domain-containing phosphohydrolase, partial [Leptolinea sp.]
IRPVEDVPRFMDNVMMQRPTLQHSGEWRHLLKDGTIIDVEITSHTLRMGKQDSAFVVAHDITARKQVEKEIANLAKFPSENPNPILRLSWDGIILYANTASNMLMDEWGCKVGNFAPKIWRDLAAQTLISRGIIIEEIVCNNKVYAISVTPIAESGYVNLYGLDITARKQGEARIHQQLEHLTALSSIDRVIAANFDLQLSLSEILTHVTIELGIDAADILISDANSQILEYAAGRGFRTQAKRDTQINLGESYAGRAALERQLIKIPNLQEEPENPFLISLLKDEGFQSYYGVPLIIKGQVKGVLEVFHRTRLNPDAEWFDFLNALTGQTAIAIENSTLFESLQHSNLELTQAYNATIEGWSRALDLRDKETEWHTLRVTEMTVELAQAFGMSADELVQVRWGAQLHDIGKMGVPDEILHKPGPLSDDEWVIMKMHPTFAYEMLSPIHYLRLALDIPYCHHEKWDGSGYPQGLRGKQIPLVARIFAVVDVWDALSSNRPYRPAWSEEKVREYIHNSSGTHFDPQVVKIFLRE